MSFAVQPAPQGTFTCDRGQLHSVCSADVSLTRKGEREETWKEERKENMYNSDLPQSSDVKLKSKHTFSLPRSLTIVSV